MQFTKFLRDAVRSGAVTKSVRVWMRPHVTAGKRYAFEGGQIEIDSIEAIIEKDITAKLARECGFKSVDDLMKVAKHGRGENIYLVEFHYVANGRRNVPRSGKR